MAVIDKGKGIGCFEEVLVIGRPVTECDGCNVCREGSRHEQEEEPVLRLAYIHTYIAHESRQQIVLVQLEIGGQIRVLRSQVHLDNCGHGGRHVKGFGCRPGRTCYVAIERFGSVLILAPCEKDLRCFCVSLKDDMFVLCEKNSLTCS